MAPARVQRLHACGWSIKSVLFFEGPFTPVTGVGSGIVRNYGKAVYWRTLYATCGVIDSLDETELKFVAEHEQEEIDDIEKEYASAADPAHLSAFTTLDEEARRHEPEIEVLREKYGESVDSAMRKVQETAGQYPVIPRHVLLFWQTSYLVERYEEFSEDAISMMPKMLSEEAKAAFKAVLDKVAMKEYGSDAPVETWSKLLQTVLSVPAEKT